MDSVFNDQNFEKEVLKSDIPVLVDFFAVWCGPCQIMAPIIEEVAKETEARLPSLARPPGLRPGEVGRGAKATGGQGKIKVGKLNVDESPQTAQKYGIMSIPTMILFKNGEVVKTIVGLRSKEEILKEITF